MTSEPPFQFDRGEFNYVDQANGLRLRVYGWPDYRYSAAVEPLDGEQAEAWPISRRAYFEFGYWQYRPVEPSVKIAFALPHMPFEADFPGRTHALLDAVYGLLGPLYAKQAIPGSELESIADEIRLHLVRGEPYWISRNDLEAAPPT